MVIARPRSCSPPFWNPFGDKLTGEPGSDVALVGRAFKIGLRTTF